MISTKIRIHNFALFIFQHDLIESPYNIMRIVSDRVEPRLVYKTAAVSHIEYEGDIIWGALRM